MFYCEIFNILFSHQNEDIGRFSNLHWCTFKTIFAKIRQTRATPFLLKRKICPEFDRQRRLEISWAWQGTPISHEKRNKLLILKLVVRRQWLRIIVYSFAYIYKWEDSIWGRSYWTEGYHPSFLVLLLVFPGDS